MAKKNENKKETKGKASANTAKKTSAAKNKKTTKAKTTSKRLSRAARTIEIVSPTTKKTIKIKGYSEADLAEFKEVILKKRDEILENLASLREQMMDLSTGQYVNEN